MTYFQVTGTVCLASASSPSTKMTVRYCCTTKMCCALTSRHSRGIMPARKNVKSVNNSNDFFCNFPSEKGAAN